MPVVTISVKQLNSLLKKQPQDAPSKDRQEDYTMDTLVDALEQLGCDVEDTVEIVMYHCPACDTLNEKLDKEEAATRCSFCGHDQEEAFDKFATDSSIRLDLLADRPDLFNVGGLARALRGYLGLEEGMTDFQCEESDIEVEVDPSVLEIRPYIVCAAAELPPLDHYSLRELMKLQENIHWGIGRDRKLASIGIYDLDSITTSITYKSVEPTEFKFHPLAFPDVKMTPKEILEKHPKGMAYAKLLEKLPRYPLLIDSKGQTLSMPPIINSEETKCRIGTTRLFIDVTGIGEQAVTDALNILVCELV
ncbi:MAG: hypothetical protein GY757_43035, partial [bacterium]|nr:hypothetical protein [bacterium]